MEVNSLNHFKSVFASQFFVKAADQNYVVARWARIVGLTRESFIQAHQAIEKYLKAALVVNGVNVSRYQHNIEDLFERHLQVFEGLAVRQLSKPQELLDHFWQMPEASTFIRHIELNGNPNSRYRLTSFAARRSDIFTLDELVRQLRRLIVGLDWIVGQDWLAADEIIRSHGLTYRDALTQHPNFQVRGAILPLGWASENANLNLRDAFLTGNLSFSGDLAPEHRIVPPTVAAIFGPLENSYLFLLAEALRSGQVSQDVRDGAVWVTENIYLPAATRDELRALAVPV